MSEELYRAETDAGQVETYLGADQAWTPAHRKERRITMSEWQPIETAPQTGCEIQYRRVIDGRIAFDGLCKWGVRCARAPARQPFTAYSPGFGLITDPPDSNVDTATWITPDEMYLVPMPTHWAPT